MSHHAPLRVVGWLLPMMLAVATAAAENDSASKARERFQKSDESAENEAIALATDARHRDFRARALRMRTTRVHPGASPGVPSVNGWRADDNMTVRFVDGSGRTLTLSEALAHAGADELADRQSLALALAWLTSPQVLHLALMPALLSSLFASASILIVGPAAMLFGLVPVALLQLSVSIALVGVLAVWGVSYFARWALAVDEGHAQLLVVEHNRRVAREVGLDESEIPAAYLVGARRR